jgi:hypothetical protein
LESRCTYLARLIGHGAGGDQRPDTVIRTFRIAIGDAAHAPSARRGEQAGRQADRAGLQAL